MAARISPSKGGKPDKLMRDALMLALRREAIDADGKKTKKLNIIAAKLVELAIGGEIQAIKEIADRVDGKPAQAIVGGGEGENPIDIVTKILLVAPGHDDSAG